MTLLSLFFAALSLLAAVASGREGMHGWTLLWAFSAGWWGRRTAECALRRIDEWTARRGAP